VEPFYTTLKLHELYHLKNLLESAGIRCTVRNEHLSTLAGEVPFIECAAQLVLRREEDRPAALEVLRGWRSPGARREPWQCGGCGERLEGQFTSCWNCGTERGR
jgi:hypothetical protein